jgi:hypothetical protein
LASLALMLLLTLVPTLLLVLLVLLLLALVLPCLQGWRSCYGCRLPPCASS